MKHMKAGAFILTLSLLLAILAFMPVTASAADEITVMVGDNIVVFPDAKPFVDANGRTMVPLRPIAGALRMDVEWKDQTQQAVFTLTNTEDTTDCFYSPKGDFKHTHFLGQEEMTFTVGSKIMSYKETWIPSSGYDGVPISDKMIAKSSEDIVMDTEAIIVDGRTYAPVRYLAEAVRADIDWDAATNTVMIIPNYAIYPEDKEPPVLTDPNPPSSHNWHEEQQKLKKAGICGDARSLPDPCNALYFYPWEYPGLEVKKVTLTSVRFNGLEISFQHTTKWEDDYLRIYYFEHLVTFTRPLAGYSFDCPDDFDWSSDFVDITVVIEYVDGNSVTVDDYLMLIDDSGV